MAARSPASGSVRGPAPAVARRWPAVDARRPPPRATGPCRDPAGVPGPAQAASWPRMGQTHRRPASANSVPPVSAGTQATLVCGESEARGRTCMAESVYRVTQVIGTSTDSWEAAARNAVETAARTVRDLRVAEVEQLDVTIENGRVTSYRAKVNISFKYDTGD